MNARSTKILSTLRRAVLIAPVAVGLTLGAAMPAFANEEMDGHDDHAATKGAPTAEEQTAATSLLEATEASLARYADIDAAVADGYRVLEFKPVRGGLIEQTHAMHPVYLNDGGVLDPERPEGLVYIKLPDGTILLVGAMFTAPVGEGPTPGGSLTVWHTHYRCAGNPGFPLPAGVSTCADGSDTISPDREMIHVWIFAHPDGTFAHNLPLDAVFAAIAELT